MLDSFGLDINMFSKEYFNSDEDEKEFYKMADILLNRDKSKKEYKGLQHLHFFSPGDACPICDSEMMRVSELLSTKQCVCHACGLESKLTLNGTYELNLDEFSWKIALTKVEPDEEILELMKTVKASQGDVFALYRLLLNGNTMENVDEKMEKMKESIRSSCESLTDTLKVKKAENEEHVKQNGTGIDMKKINDELELGNIINQYFGNK